MKLINGCVDSRERQAREPRVIPWPIAVAGAVGEGAVVRIDTGYGRSRILERSASEIGESGGRWWEAL